MLKNKKNQKEMFKKEIGITLVALVVTIIVLIILATISINIIFSEDGIMARARQAQEAQREAEAKERVQLMLPDYIVERELNDKKLVDYLAEQKNKGNLDSVEDGTTTVTVGLNGYLITIDKETLEIKDVAKNGKEVKISLTANSAKLNETVTATIEFGDEIDKSKCRWVYSTDSSATIGEENYPSTNTFASNTINLTATTEGTYYLHILVVDKDGNVTEKVSEKILVGNYVTSITLNKTELSIEEGKTETLTATIEADEGADQTITWTSSKEGVATVDQNGLVTAVAEGETTITVTAKVGSGTKAECKVTVTGKQPVQVTADTLKGAYIEYDVEYGANYCTNAFDFTSTNGWRILNYEVDANDNTKLNNVEIISTGMPARLYYHYNDTLANKDAWWETDTTKLTNFYNTVLGGSTYGGNTISDTSMKAAAGLYNNFGSINFAYATSSRGYNLGYFEQTIKAANGTTYDSSNTNTVTGEELFVIDGVATGVRLLTLPEVNEANNLTFNQTSTALTDTTGLYKLQSLTLKNSSGTSVTPYASNGYYWVASPWPSGANHVCSVYYYGNISNNNYYNYGVRPVVSLGSGVQLIQETDANGDVYYSID